MKIKYKANTKLNFLIPKDTWDFAPESQWPSFWLGDIRIKNDNITKFVHNAMFDIPFIYKKWRVITRGVRCTKSLAKIVRKCAGNSYKRLTKKAAQLVCHYGVIQTTLFFIH